MSSNRRVIFGFHAISSRLRQNPQSIDEIYIDESRHDVRVKELIEKAKYTNIHITLTDSKRLEQISKSNKHQGVVALIDASKNHIDLEDVLDSISEPPFLLLLDGITDPHNLGACLRTADAMGVHAVIAPKDNCVGLNATVSKTACGAAEVVPYIMVTNLARTIRQLKERDIWILGTDMNADTDLYHCDIPSSVAWVLGSEGYGMRRLTRENCDILVSIPMFGTVESLNVSVSTGMVLSETRRQRVIQAA